MTIQAAGDLPIGEPKGESQGVLARLAYSFTQWAEKWFPDAFVFVIFAVIVVAIANFATGASPIAVAKGFATASGPSSHSPCRWPWSSSRDTCSPPRRSAPS